MVPPAEVRRPTVTVVVATRERPQLLRRCVTSVLASAHPSFEVLVVDQSEEPADLPRDARLVYLHHPGRGKSAGLNVALGVARGEILAFTDDDCTVPADWLSKAEAVLAGHPEVAMVFGDLVPMEHDPTTAFVPPAALGRFRVIEGAHHADQRGGAGANMIARRSLFRRIGGYDELIGPGSRFAACEEYDIYYRALAAGLRVAMDPDLVTTHWGIRSYGDGSGQLLKRRYAYGEGAVIAKHLRLGDRHIMGPAWRIVLGDVGFAARSLAHGRMTGLGTLAYKCRGMASGLCTPVDRGRRVFASPRSRRRAVDAAGSRSRRAHFGA